MDVVSQGIRDPSPWRMLFADDIMICSTDREIVELKTGAMEEGIGRQRIENQQKEDRVS